MNATQRHALSVENEDPGRTQLWSSVCFSAGLHAVIVGSLLLWPPGASKRPMVNPVYTVDLVGGAGPQKPLASASPEAIDPPARPEPVKAEAKHEVEEKAPVTQEPEEAVTETPTPDAPVLDPEPVANKDPEVAKEIEKPPEPLEEKPAAPPEKVAKAEAVPAAVEKQKSETKAEKEPQEKPAPKVVQKEVPKRPKKTKKVVKRVRKKPVQPVRRVASRKKKTVNPKTDAGALERLREKRIEAAVAKVRQRAGTQGATDAVAGNDAPWREALAGTGQGSGRGVGSGVGNGGGDVKSLEFVIYRNRMLDQIKNMWTWVGKRTDLEVTVRFGVDRTGGVFALQIIGASDDPSYDESVIRAVMRASPLPPPPATYLQDFSDVELTFRPGDLSG